MTRKRAPRSELAPRAGPELEHRRRGLGLRLLICDTCASCWPTERDEAHGGSRQDGEWCAYRWPNGKVCMGRVWPGGAPGRRHAQDPFQWEAPPAQRAAYAGQWCAILDLPWGTTDLAVVRKRYRALALKRHPDQGGTEEAMKELNEAYRAALAELGG